MAILAQGHVLMEDVPGVGKTTTALTFAKGLGLDTRRVQFTSDTVPSDVIGYSVYDKSGDSSSTSPVRSLTNLLLADEINRTSSKTQSALLEAMEEHRVTVTARATTTCRPPCRRPRDPEPPPARLGTTLLPSSQLDRFLIRLSMGYPDHKSQINILRDRQSANLNRVQPVVVKDNALNLSSRGAKSRGQRPHLRLCDHTGRGHPHPSHGRAGISPRGALALCRMAKAHAFLAGRDFVMPRTLPPSSRTSARAPSHFAAKAGTDGQNARHFEKNCEGSSRALFKNPSLFQFACVPACIRLENQLNGGKRST